MINAFHGPWESVRFLVLLERAFLPTHSGPRRECLGHVDHVKPARMLASRKPRLTLRGPGLPPLIDGQAASILSRNQYAALKALVDQYLLHLTDPDTVKPGLTKDELDDKSVHEAVKRLKEI